MLGLDDFVDRLLVQAARDVVEPAVVGGGRATRFGSKL